MDNLGHCLWKKEGMRTKMKNGKEKCDARLKEILQIWHLVYWRYCKKWIMLTLAHGVLIKELDEKNVDIRSGRSGGYY